MNGDEQDEQLYRYSGSQILRNRLDLRDEQALAYAERMLVRQRMEEGCPAGDFDLKHLKAIHRHLFQDLYDWAGEVRLVPLRKADSQFFAPERIPLAIQDIHSRIRKLNYLQQLAPDQFAGEAGTIIGDLNLVHPFREGNGRTQLLYLKQLAAKAGHGIDLSRLGREEWIEASVRASRADPDYGLMRKCIGRSID